VRGVTALKSIAQGKREPLPSSRSQVPVEQPRNLQPFVRAEPPSMARPLLPSCCPQRHPLPVSSSIRCLFRLRGLELRNRRVLTSPRNRTRSPPGHGQAFRSGSLLTSCPRRMRTSFPHRIGRLAM